MHHDHFIFHILYGHQLIIIESRWVKSCTHNFTTTLTTCLDCSMVPSRISWSRIWRAEGQEDRFGAAPIQSLMIGLPNNFVRFQWFRMAPFVNPNASLKVLPLSTCHILHLYLISEYSSVLTPLSGIIVYRKNIFICLQLVHFILRALLRCLGGTTGSSLKNRKTN